MCGRPPHIRAHPPRRHTESQRLFADDLLAEVPDPGVQVRRLDDFILGQFAHVADVLVDLLDGPLLVSLAFHDAFQQQILRERHPSQLQCVGAGLSGGLVDVFAEGLATALELLEGLGLLASLPLLSLMLLSSMSLLS